MSSKSKNASSWLLNVFSCDLSDEQQGVESYNAGLTRLSTCDNPILNYLQPKAISAFSIRPPQSLIRRMIQSSNSVQSFKSKPRISYVIWETSEIKKPRINWASCEARCSLFAEAEGFEPPVPCGTPVFKTGAIDQLCQTSKQIANLDNFSLFLMFGVIYILSRTNKHESG